MSIDMCLYILLFSRAGPASGSLCQINFPRGADNTNDLKRNYRSFAGTYFSNAKLCIGKFTTVKNYEWFQRAKTQKLSVESTENLSINIR